MEDSLNKQTNEQRKQHTKKLITTTRVSVTCSVVGCGMTAVAIVIASS